MHYTYEPEHPEAVLTFYQKGKERRARVMMDETLIADLVHDGSLHMLLDRRLLDKRLIRIEGFRLNGPQPQKLVARLQRLN